MSRIVSFLPAGTEIVHALGAGGELVGRSHECDYPPEVRKLPVVSRPALSLEGMSQQEIDAAVAARLRDGQSLYEVDERLLADLDADVLITQDLCQVCAPSGNELTRAIRDLPREPHVLWLTPRDLAEIEENIRAVGDAVDRRAEADRLIESNRARMERVARSVAAAPARRVVFLEWTDPLFCAGHWVPEMVTLAGGDDPLGRAGADSQRISWDAVTAANPETIVVSPCGMRLEQAAELAGTLPDAGAARVYAVDANAYFARPGPRMAEGVELLAHLFHPSRFDWPNDGKPWKEISRGAE